MLLLTLLHMPFCPAFTFLIISSCQEHPTAAGTQRRHAITDPPPLLLLRSHLGLFPSAAATLFCPFCFSGLFISFTLHPLIFLLDFPLRFALVGVGSEASSKKLMDLLPKRELHGQNPVVTPCNKQFLSQFELQSRKSKYFY